MQVRPLRKRHWGRHSLPEFHCRPRLISPSQDFVSTPREGQVVYLFPFFPLPPRLQSFPFSPPAIPCFHVVSPFQDLVVRFRGVVIHNHALPRDYSSSSGWCCFPGRSKPPAAQGSTSCRPQICRERDESQCCQGGFPDRLGWLLPTCLPSRLTEPCFERVHRR